jgi:hypothetical protein
MPMPGLHAARPAVGLSFVALSEYLLGRYGEEHGEVLSSVSVHRVQIQIKGIGVHEAKLLRNAAPFNLLYCLYP